MPAAGEIIGGKYRLLEPISDELWKGVHETLQSTVVIKFVAQGGKEAKARFIREARSAAAIRHDNVVSIIDFGTTEGGEPYMILEYLEGETLADRMRSDPPMSAAEALHHGTLALTGLAAVHDAGIVHRNLNPSAIILVRDAEGGYPKIIDFGISKTIDSDSGQQLTLEGMVLGLPEYISPEQARGERDIDARADLYSMGVILFELLIGHRPFEPASSREMLVRKMTDEAPRIAELRPELGTAISDVIARALAREPADRWEDARAMRQALIDADRAIDPEVRKAAGPKAGAFLAKQPKKPVERAAEQKGSSPPWILLAAIAALALAAIAAVVELVAPGTILSSRAPVTDPGAAGAIVVVDAGIRETDAGPQRTIDITILDVPPGSSIVLDGTTFGPAAVDAHRRRRPRSTVELTLGQRASAYDLIVRAPGKAPWTARRWALRDATFTPRFDPEE